jgi:2-polyprenyl-3-methyl-5-hydroxy-6-metoxy-1,4-benzoquinol methylase
MLARRLAERCEEVVAIDLDQKAIRHARDAVGSDGRVTYINGDVMAHPFAMGTFDFIAAVASLHHLPLEAALARFQSLLSPDGMLVIVGLYRFDTFPDYAWAAAAFPMSWMLRSLRGRALISAPVQEPKQTLNEIREACGNLLPGSFLQRRFFFRYSVVWRKRALTI